MNSKLTGFGMILFGLGAFALQARQESLPSGGGNRSAGAPARAGGFRGSGQSQRAPMVIRMGRQGAPRPQSAPRPSWGQMRQAPEPGRPAKGLEQAPRRATQEPASSRPSPAQHQGLGQRQGQAAGEQAQPTRLSPRSFAPKGGSAAFAVHHHPYTEGYVRRKLQNIGVTTEPKFITDRAEMMHSDNRHSSVALPSRGPGDGILKAALVGPRGGGAAMVRGRMAIVGTAAWQGNADRFNRTEDKPGHYYWHHEDGQDYAHYRDAAGYNWYGWYAGEQCFWARNYEGRWWWYDSAYDRWSFYDADFWWWQDPYHVGDLYCYDNGEYVPVNSQEDQIVVTQDSGVDMKASSSPDGTRTVKVVAESGDAFLYDDSQAPAFDPIYLASGVTRVEFSDTGNGRPLEIVLKLTDGSFDLFDGEGRPYNPGPAETDADTEASPQGILPSGAAVPAAP